MELKSMERHLGCRHRSLRTLPGKLLFGSAGARLFVDYLDETPGFMGRIDFIHKLNLPGLFGIGLSSGEFVSADTVWYPDRSEAVYHSGEIRLREEKFITWDDCAVCRIRWENRGNREETLRLYPAPGWRIQAEDGVWRLERDCRTHSLRMRAVLTVETEAGCQELKMPPGGSGSFAVSAAVGERETDSWEELQAKIRPDTRNAEQLSRLHREEYSRWYGKAPVFSCSDPLYETTWAYRWFLLRHNYAVPGRGNLRHGVFYEGRSHKLAKDEDQVSGHEFSQLIPLSVPLQLMDARWKRGAEECLETVRVLLDNADGDGLFPTVKIDGTDKIYGNFAAWAVWQVMLVLPDMEFARQVLPGLKRYVHGIGKVYCPDGDVLPICRNHRLTGKEYQPSFWYFMGYPEQVNGSSSFEPVRRVDLAVYYYLNALGTAELCRMTGDSQETEFRDLAERIRAAVLTRMWDEKTGFFYDLNPETDEKAMVKSVTGIYPLWAGMPGVDARRLTETFLTPGLFALGSGFASTAKDCPVFSAQGGWNKLFFKGRNGCIWNGPSWPYTTGIALDALARAEKAGIDCGGAFAKILREYMLEHYRFGDIRQPYLVEHYDCETGEMLSDEPDYLHSFLLDLIIRHVAGIQPEPWGIRIAPLPMGLSSFELSGLWIAGHEIRAACRDGVYQVWMDGEEVCRLDDFPKNGRLPLPADKGENGGEYGIPVRFDGSKKK